MRTRFSRGAPWKARDGWRLALETRCPGTMRRGPGRDCVLAREPDAGLRARVSQKAVEAAHAVRVTGDAIVQADDHHAPALRAFFVELVELVAQRLLVGRRAPAGERERHDVVEMERIRHRHEVAPL